jgi:nitroimidazol reductase NimA-like FMN-containing flavoprotein (pyridoxamine 5'-phosphate oxidase superfamily)
MRLIDERTGLDVLDREECLRLLALHHVGRVAFVDGGRPTVLPVNYVLDGEAVVFRTDEGAKLASATREAFVAFEIDAAEGLAHTGWSVVLSGRAEEVTDRVELSRLAQLPLRPWAKGAKAHWIRIPADRLTGRRVVQFHRAPR